MAEAYERPTLEGLLRAREVVAQHLEPTPLRSFSALSAELGCELHLKLECLQPTGAFKIRGGLHLISSLAEAERRAGVAAASTGNHGQSIALAARIYGVQAIQSHQWT